MNKKDREMTHFGNELVDYIRGMIHKRWDKLVVSKAPGAPEPTFTLGKKTGFDVGTETITISQDDAIYMSDNSFVDLYLNYAAGIYKATLRQTLTDGDSPPVLGKVQVV